MQALIQIEGLDELRKGFRQAGGKALEKSLAGAHHAIALAVVPKLETAVKAASTPGGSKAVINATRTKNYAAVRFKGKKSTAVATVLGRKIHNARAGRDWRYARRIPLGQMKRAVWQSQKSSWNPTTLYAVGSEFEKFQKTFQLDAYRKAVVETLEASFS